MLGQFSAAIIGFSALLVVTQVAEAATTAEIQAAINTSTTSSSVQGFYAQRAYAPAWSEEAGNKILAQMRAIALQDGLDPAAYEVTAQGASRDIAISEMVLSFGQSLAIGRVSPTPALGGLGEQLRPPFNGKAFLTDLVKSSDPQKVLHNLAPPYTGYARLRAALATYQALANNNWPHIPNGPTLRPYESDPRLEILAQRLMAEGYLTEGRIDTASLSGPLLEALQAFQERNGLNPDGSVGPQTLAALNMSPNDRIAQIKANLERWRWMPDQLDSSHITVNIPAAHLELVDNGEIKISMRVVVGDVKSPTPTMATSLRSIVLNPTWTVPPSIATREILPKLKRNPEYLAANNMYILDAFPEGSPESQGVGVDWNSMTRLPYRLRQAAGPENALGQIKFNLTNSDAIYLHDTPRRQYFDRIFRALSHGCVRLERPIDLAKALIAPEWAARLDGLIESAQTKTLLVRRPITVYLMYQTAWADEDGTIHFREDLYGHDKKLTQALRRATNLSQQAKLP